MSAYQMAVRSVSVFQSVQLSAFRARFWTWWASLYADPPRKLPPML